MSKKHTTLVTLVLDKTGSMETCRDQVILGFNEYIEELKKDKKSKFLFTLTKFAQEDDQHLKVSRPYEGAKLSEVKPLDRESYIPGGLTPLYDAIGSTIVKTEGIKGYDKVLFVIMTDGFENASSEYSRAAIFKKIKEKEKLGNWTFAFLGADQDAYANSAAIGISLGNTFKYDSKETQSTYASLARSTVKFGMSNLMCNSSFCVGMGGTSKEGEDKDLVATSSSIPNPYSPKVKS